MSSVCYFLGQCKWQRTKNFKIKKYDIASAMKVSNFRIMLECTIKSTKQGLEQGLALKDKNKDNDLIFKDKDTYLIHKD